MPGAAELLQLEGRGVLVTGASSGIGRALALRLAGLGARVALLGRDRERLEAVLQACPGTGHTVLVHDLDAGMEGIPAALQGLAAASGRLHGLVHCAGAHLTMPLRSQSIRSLEQILRINVEAGLMLAKAFRRPEVHGDGGSLVFLSSIMGHVGTPGLAAYSASKGAVEAMTRSLALELAPEQIRVNALAPGYVRTELFASMKAKLTQAQLEAIEHKHPLGMGEPDQVADAAVFLLSGMSSWMTGATLVVDGGYTAQ